MGKAATRFQKCSELTDIIFHSFGSSFGRQ